MRQQFYLRALSGNSRIDTYMGKFNETKPRMHKVPEVGCQCCSVPPGRPKCTCCSGNTIQVVKYEEKSQMFNWQFNWLKMRTLTYSTWPL
jgi:hypothetical protein